MTARLANIAHALAASGDYGFAALAAANSAADFEHGVGRTWSGLRGGACGREDQVTPWIVRPVDFELQLLVSPQQSPVF